jgi:hypothetical protein
MRINDRSSFDSNTSANLELFYYDYNRFSFITTSQAFPASDFAFFSKIQNIYHVPPERNNLQRTSDCKYGEMPFSQAIL